MDPTKLGDGRLLRSPDQGVGERDQQPPGAVAVDVGIDPAQIAQGPLDPETLRLEEKPLMGRTPAGGGDGESDLEGHVESRCTIGELNPAEVVEGIPTGRDQLQDSVETACGPGDLECGSRAEPETAKTRDERQEEGFVASVIRNVEKGVVGRISLSDQSASACCRPPRCISSLRAALIAGRLPAKSKSSTAAVSLQVLGHHRPKFPVSLGGDPEHARRRRGRRVGSGDHRTGSQRHGLTLRSEGFSCQRRRKHTVAQPARRKRS